jgi:hypothetical protein
MILKGLKSAEVVEILKGIATWQVSHKRPNCKGFFFF